MKRENKLALTQVFYLRAQLLGIKPVIWREFAILADCSLAHLHAAIQGAMGWYDAHLHVFIIDGKLYHEPDEDNNFDASSMPINSKFLDESQFKLGRLLMVNDKFKYEYDMGDSWMHELTVINVDTLTNHKKPWAWLIDGDRACPPEDVGGILGYKNMVKALKTKPKSIEAKEYLEWLGYMYDPDNFNLKEANLFMQKSLSRR